MNAINIIRPYKISRDSSTWVFDDPSKGLDKEPFVGEVNTMIDIFTRDIENAEDGFMIMFSETPFPGYRHQIEKVNSEYGGNWYKSDELEMQGWLCPALLRYFESPPEAIYFKIEKSVHRAQSGKRETGI